MSHSQQNTVPKWTLGVFLFNFCVSMRMIIAVNSGYAQERIMENIFDQQVSVTVKENGCATCT